MNHGLLVLQFSRIGGDDLRITRAVAKMRVRDLPKRIACNDGVTFCVRSRGRQAGIDVDVQGEVGVYRVDSFRLIPNGVFHILIRRVGPDEQFVVLDVYIAQFAVFLFGQIDNSLILGFYDFEIHASILLAIMWSKRPAT